VAHDRQLERALLLLNVGLVLASLAVAHLLRGYLATLVPGLKPSVPLHHEVLALAVFAPAWAWGAERLGLHRAWRVLGPVLYYIRAIVLTQAWGTVALALILTAAQIGLNRSFIALFLVISTTLLALSKPAQAAWLRRHRGATLTLVVDKPPAEGIDEAILGLERFRGRQIERLETADPSVLRRRLWAGGVDEVVLPGFRDSSELRSLLEVCEEVGVAALVRVESIEMALARPRVELVGPMLYLGYRTYEPDRPALFIKALLDRVLAGLALALVLPLMAGVALLIKATSSGPVLFIQQRAGLHGRPFPLLKFRTMRVGAEAEREGLLGANEMDGPVFKMSRDPRVTAIGQVLRWSSLDELPQLLNVLAGQMSLVGPRPLPLVESQALAGAHRRRLSFKPGITGLWQVSGRSDLTFRDWMVLDLQYIDNWSLGLDLAVLLRTLPALLFARGAR
jgi:exopolysaccharide biosynthesis polyprenyl glycosylphosphotransferase